MTGTPTLVHESYAILRISGLLTCERISKGVVRRQFGLNDDLHYILGALQLECTACILKKPS